MSLAGCFGGDDGGSDEHETPVETLEEWQVHFANSASDLPECNDDRDGWLYYVSTDENFQVCTQNGWEIIDITGPSGADGTNGVDGQDGADGTNGVDGQDGADGTHGFDGQDGADGTDGMDGQDGTSILINVVSSTACLSGGNTFEIGSDDDADGVLSISEVHVTVDICDGAEGPQGPTGADGQDGSNALFSMTPESTGSNCANGGTRIDVGVDDNSNGVLETSEIDQTQYVCDGGSSNNTMLTSISSPPANLGCDAGGQVIAHGLDNGDGGGTYANGVLETGEIDTTMTVCSTYEPMMFKDIYPSTGHGYPYYLTAVGNTLYFVANDGTNGTNCGRAMEQCFRHGDG